MHPKTFLGFPSIFKPGEKQQRLNKQANKQTNKKTTNQTKVTTCLLKLRCILQVSTINKIKNTRGKILFHSDAVADM